MDHARVRLADILGSAAFPESGGKGLFLQGIPNGDRPDPTLVFA